jgi:hypothetical protein
LYGHIRHGLSDHSLLHGYAREQLHRNLLHFGAIADGLHRDARHRDGLRRLQLRLQRQLTAMPIAPTSGALALACIFAAFAVWTIFYP